MKRYWENSLSPSHNYVLALVLLALYELGKMLFISGPVKIVNAVDAWFNYLLQLLPYRTWMISLAIALIGLIFFYQDRKRDIRLSYATLFFMWLEALVWAIVVFQWMPWIMKRLLAMKIIRYTPTFLEAITLSLGAGFYEELFFRLLLVQGFFLLLRLFKKDPRHPLWVLFVVVFCAFLFALAHHIGPFADPLKAPIFAQRMIFGLLMNVLLVFRGFAITAWCHAWYDVLIDLFRFLF